MISDQFFEMKEETKVETWEGEEKGGRQRKGREFEFESTLIKLGVIEQS